jgi:hypothetical protein
MTDVSTLRNVTVEMFRLHFPRATILNLLSLTLGAESASAFLDDVEDSIVARAVVKL